jgi:hypothetical protein
VKNGLVERALAGSNLGQPPPEGELGPSERVETGVGAHKHQAADEVGMAKRELLRDRASNREAGDVGGRDLEGPQQRGRVVGHDRHR